MSQPVPSAPEALRAPGAGVCGAIIAGTGLALPATVVSNHDLAQRVQTSDEWIVQRTGIRQRYVCEPGTGVRDLARRAVQGALQRAGIKPAELDLLLLCTMTPEMCCPSSAARLVADLGAIPAGAIDLSAACAGFVYGLNFAAGLIQSGAVRRVAVVGAEHMSQIIDWNDRRTCILFGDGAGAAILTASEDRSRGCLHQIMGSNGEGWKELYCPRQPEHVPPGDSEFSGAYHKLQMNGREVYKFAVSTLRDTVETVLRTCNLKADDLAMIVAHQSNQRILEAAREKLGLSESKLYINIDRVANTSAASVPICLHELVESGRLKAGDLVLFVALGGGLTWASSLWRL